MSPPKNVALPTTFLAGPLISFSLRHGGGGFFTRSTANLF